MNAPVYDPRRGTRAKMRDWHSSVMHYPTDPSPGWEPYGMRSVLGKALHPDCDGDCRYQGSRCTPDDRCSWTYANGSEVARAFMADPS